MKKIVSAFVLLILINSTFLSASADDGEPFRGLPSNTVISVSGLDDTGQLIYAGIDFAVFQDEDKDGIFTVKEGKVKRFITNHTTITIDLGNPTEYEKGVMYKLAMRTLYVPTGPEENGAGEIIIADYSNGKEGWVLIPNSEFIPTYFAVSDGDSFIRHTEKWEENRQKYNESKIAAGLESMVRPYGVFWSGEKFMIDIQATEEVPAVRVSIKDSSYSQTITASAVTTSGAIYRGELWNKDMLNKWGNYIPKKLTFTVDALDESDAVLETFEATILIDNRDLYYRVKKAY
ncbi:MAG: hypothetical protein EOM59_06570 [Clostridia bacterium]|nr:hypothetical protein [Clostridia bacterium]